MLTINVYDSVSIVDVPKVRFPVTIKSVGNSNSSSSTTCAINAPSGIQVGDLLVAIITTTTSVSTLAGWTAHAVAETGITTFKVCTFWKIAEAGDTSESTYTFSLGSNAQRTGTILRVTGHDPVNPLTDAELIGVTGITEGWPLLSQTLSGIPDTCSLGILAGGWEDNGTGWNLQAYRRSSAEPASGFTVTKHVDLDSSLFVGGVRWDGTAESTDGTYGVWRGHADGVSGGGDAILMQFGINSADSARGTSSVSFRSYSMSTGSTTISAPAGMAEGDLLILRTAIQHSGGNNIVTWAGTQNWHPLGLGVSSGGWWKFATADDVTAGSFSVFPRDANGSYSNNTYSSIAAFTGADPVNPVIVGPYLPEDDAEYNPVEGFDVPFAGALACLSMVSSANGGEMRVPIFTRMPANFERIYDYRAEGGAESNGGSAIMAYPVATPGDTGLVAAYLASGTIRSLSAFAILPARTTVDQEGYRFRKDDGSESSATWWASQDTNLTGGNDTNLRLRLTVNTEGESAPEAYRLEYKKSDESLWLEVGDGAGTPSFGSLGGVGSGSTSMTVNWTSGFSRGDLLVMVIVSKYTQVPDTPSGWTLVSGAQRSTSGLGSGSNDAGDVSATIFVRVADGTENGSGVSVSTPSANASAGRMFYMTATPGKVWDFEATNGVLLTGTTSWSVPMDSAINIQTGDVVLVAAGQNSDTGALSSPSISATGITSQTAEVRGTASTTTGTDARVSVTSHVITGGSSSSAPTFIATGSSSTPEAALVMLRVRQKDAPIQLATSPNISTQGAATTAQLSAPSGKTTADFTPGRLESANPLTEMTVAEDEYTELEWCIRATDEASPEEVYQFRITVDGMPLKSYTVTPEWTMGLEPFYVSAVETLGATEYTAAQRTFVVGEDGILTWGVKIYP